MVVKMDWIPILTAFSFGVMLVETLKVLAIKREQQAVGTSGHSADVYLQK